MHACTTASSHTVVIASGRALRPSQTAMQTSWTPRFFSSVSTCSQNLAPSPPSPAHRPEDVAFPAHGDPDDDIDRLVADLPVADLDHDRVDEDHRIDRVQRPVAPLGHLLDHLVGDLGDRLLATPRRRRPRRSAPRSPRSSTRGRSATARSHRPRSAGVAASSRSAARSCASVSRGTSISTGPISVSTVFARTPLRELPRFRPTGSCLS